jgi:hypothetical protein
VLSHQFHRARLQSDPAIVGRELRLNDRLVTVVGVAPQEFPDFDLDNPQMWLLIDQIDQLNAGTAIEDDWTSPAIEVYGRLRPGVSLNGAADGLKPAVIALSQLQPKRFKAEERFVASDGFNSADDLRQIRTTAALIAALTLLVLLVASANFAAAPDSAIAPVAPAVVSTAHSMVGNRARILDDGEARSLGSWAMGGLFARRGTRGRQAGASN